MWKNLGQRDKPPHSVLLYGNRRDVGPSVAFERQRRIAAGGWQRPVFFSVEVVAGGTEPVQSRDIGGVFLAEGGAEDGGQESG